MNKFDGQKMAGSLAECLAVYGLPYTFNFTDESTLVVQKVMHGNGANVVEVVASSDDYIDKGFHVFLTDLWGLTKSGKEYEPLHNGWKETNLLKLYSFLQETIVAEGGHDAFWQKVDEEIEGAKLANEQAIDALKTANLIRKDLVSGKLSGDITNLVAMPMLVGGEIDGKPFVLESYQYGYGKKMWIKLRTAPLGVPGGKFDLEVFTSVAKLLETSEEGVEDFVLAFRSFIIGLVPKELMEGFKATVIKLVGGKKLVMRPQPAAETAPVSAAELQDEAELLHLSTQVVHEAPSAVQ